MPGRVLVVAAHGAKLRVFRRSIVVETREGRSTVPVSEVDRIVVVTSTVSITSAAVRRLAKIGVDILFLDARGVPVVSLNPPWINETSETRLSQYRAVSDPAIRLEVAKSIVAAKIRSQASFIRALGSTRGSKSLVEEAERIERHAVEAMGAGSVDKLRVIEAHAARLYWGALATVLPSSIGFRGRDPDAGDPFNTVLNYLYALLYAWIHRYLVMYGLDPYLGFIHADRSGRPSLVYDAAELFRVSAVDRLAYRLFASGWRPVIENGLLSRETRARLVSEYSRWVRETRILDGSTGRKESIERHMALQARALAQAVRRGSGFNAFWEKVGSP